MEKAEAQLIQSLVRDAVSLSRLIPGTVEEKKKIFEKFNSESETLRLTINNSADVSHLEEPIPDEFLPEGVSREEYEEVIKTGIRYSAGLRQEDQGLFKKVWEVLGYLDHTPHTEPARQ